MGLNMYELAQYVNLDVDDVYEVEEIARWFNKGIASYNMIPPLSTYPFVEIELEDDDYKVYEHLDKNFMLSIMLPFISSAVRAQESAVIEKQEYFQEFMMNARIYKSAKNIPKEFMLNPVEDLEDYQIGENVYISDMDYSPFQSNWYRPTKRVKKYNPLDEED